MKTLLFKIAHSIKANYSTFSDALKQAWKIIKLRMKMKFSNVVFQYKKVDGSIRNAVGTLNVSYESKGGKSVNYSVVNYFDTESNGWRSFKSENLI